jgi:lysozyme family protein
MVEQLIAEIIQREGVKDTNNPNDPGGRTKYGISAKWNPEAWKNGPPTLAQAQAIYYNTYFVVPGIIRITPDYLLSQVADFGVLSGPTVAIQHLQKVLNVVQDGQMGPATLQALSTQNPIQVNNRLVDDRVLMLDRVVQKRPSDIEFIFGWHTRVLSFRKE